MVCNVQERSPSLSGSHELSTVGWLSVPSVFSEYAPDPWTGTGPPPWHTWKSRVPRLESSKSYSAAAFAWGCRLSFPGHRLFPSWSLAADWGTLDLGETWAAQCSCWFSPCVTFLPEAFWAADIRRNNDWTDWWIYRNKCNPSQCPVEASVYLVGQSQLLLWFGHCCGASRHHGCAAEVPAVSIWSLHVTSLLFILPHLHMNVWVWSWMEFLTLSANHEAREDNKRAWRTIVRSQGNRWRSDGERVTELWVNLGKWWPCRKNRCGGTREKAHTSEHHSQLIFLIHLI